MGSYLLCICTSGGALAHEGDPDTMNSAAQQHDRPTALMGGDWGRPGAQGSGPAHEEARRIISMTEGSGWDRLANSGKRFACGAAQHSGKECA